MIPRLRNSAWQALATAGRTARLVCVTAAAVLVGGSADLLACPMCFGRTSTAKVENTAPELPA